MDPAFRLIQVKLMSSLCPLCLSLSPAVSLLGQTIEY